MHASRGVNSTKADMKRADSPLLKRYKRPFIAACDHRSFKKAATITGASSWSRTRTSHRDHAFARPPNRSLLINDIFAKKIVGAEGLIGGAGAKAFRIDHPLAPETKSLSHACIESDSMKNLYDAIATLDADGIACVTLPDWFEALIAAFATS